MYTAWPNPLHPIRSLTDSPPLPPPAFSPFPSLSAIPHHCAVIAN
jgi:hypothetical protein